MRAAAALDGLILIDKPAGWTSHDVVAKVRGILGVRKAGHTGTLDPDATGVLPICLGWATKLSQYLLLSEKEYRVVMKLGETTDTQDAGGRRTGGSGPTDLPEGVVRSVLDQFVGRITQVPPMYSAVKVGGVPLYRLARKGKEVPRPSREVEIREIRFLGMEGDRVSFDVVCSKGTYIRTLCADIGERLGVGACMESLIRLRTGPFRLEDAVTLEALEAMARSERLHTRLIPPDRIVGDLPEVRLTPAAAERTLCGAQVEGAGIFRIEGEFLSGEKVRLTDGEGRLIGMGEALYDRGRIPLREKHEKIVKIDRILV